MLQLKLKQNLGFHFFWTFHADFIQFWDKNTQSQGKDPQKRSLEISTQKTYAYYTTFEKNLPQYTHYGGTV